MKIASPATTLEVFLLAALTACTDPSEVRTIEGRLRPAAAEVDVGIVWLGHPEPVRVRLLNESRADADFVAVVDSPHLEADPSAGSVAAGSAQDVEVTLLPVALGQLDNAFLRFNSGEMVVAIKGEVRAPLACDHREPCGVQQFSPEHDGCEWLPLDDGSACQGPCVVDGLCQSGHCVGEVRTCPDDDGDACTVAACDHSVGCTLVPRTCRPSSPCVTATCDSATGCAEEPVQDGSYCGEPNCDQDHVCIAGACVARPPPDDREVQRCLRAKSILITRFDIHPPRPMSCAVTAGETAVCWGNVRPAFRMDNFGPLAAMRPDDKGPWVARLGPAGSIFLGGHPLLIQRPDGQTSYLAVDDSMDHVLRHWGASGRGLHPLPVSEGIVDALRYRDGMCAVTTGGDLLCGGADYKDPGFVVSPNTPAVAGGVEAVTGPILVPCVRMASGAVRCRWAGPRYDCGLAVAARTFSPLQGVPPFIDFDTYTQGWRACGVSPWGEVYCASCGPFTAVAGLPPAKRVRTVEQAACALVEGGDVWCWGRLFPQEDWNPPRRVEGLERIVDFDLAHASVFYYPTLCALSDDGRVKCMGNNWFREAGVFESEDGGYRPELVWKPTALALPDAGIDVTF